MAGGHGGQRRGIHMGDTAGADAGAGADPFVRGIEEATEVFIAELGRRQALAPAGDMGITHGDRSLCATGLVGRLCPSGTGLSWPGNNSRVRALTPPPAYIRPCCSR